jgi:hypothetical protein
VGGRVRLRRGFIGRLGGSSGRGRSGFWSLIGGFVLMLLRLVIRKSEGPKYSMIYLVTKFPPSRHNSKTGKTNPSILSHP